MELFIAFIGLVGALLGGSLLAEMFKRFNLRSSITADLEIWAKLPDSATKTHLYDNITTRVWMSTLPARWPSAVFNICWVTGSIALFAATYGLQVHRDSEGVLRVTGFGMNVPLYFAVMTYFVILMAAFGFGAIVTRLAQGYSDWRRLREAKPEAEAEVKPEADPKAEPEITL